MTDNERMTGNDRGQQNNPVSEAAGKPKARDLNELIRYTMWSVFRVRDTGALDAAGEQVGRARDGLAAEVGELEPAGGRQGRGDPRLLRRAGPAR